MSEAEEQRGKKRNTGGKKTRTSGEMKSADGEASSFESFRLDPRLLKAVAKQFEKPTLVQAAAIPLALNGKDIVARAKTGSGKTATQGHFLQQLLLLSTHTKKESKILKKIDQWQKAELSNLDYLLLL